jgi:hypothetical protein
MLRATSNIRSLSPSSPHVATILRSCCDRVACNIQHQEPSSHPPRHKTQHHMSATSKLNIRNIKILCLQHPITRVCNIEIQHPQHQKSIFATSKIFRSNFETFTGNTCSMPSTRMQFVHNNCNMNNKSWPLEIYFCNIAH